jgi:predicted lipid-binding transport protein (Tim44 family)
MALSALCVDLLATSGCVNPDGTVNNTATGAVIGGTVGALSGAFLGGRHAGEAAFFGGVTGALAGAVVGNMIDRQQREYLQVYYPQTWYTIQHNDAVVQQQAPPPPPDSPQPTASQPAEPATSPQSSQQSGVLPLTLNDIKALTAAGVKPDAINKEIDISQSRFNAQDIATAQQANPPIDPAVIQDMKSHSS